MKAMKAVYNFLVGDMIILVGILFAFIVLLAINTLPALKFASTFSGTIFIVFIIVTLRRSLHAKPIVPNVNTEVERLVDGYALWYLLRSARKSGRGTRALLLRRC